MQRIKPWIAFGRKRFVQLFTTEFTFFRKFRNAPGAGLRYMFKRQFERIHVAVRQRLLNIEGCNLLILQDGGAS